MRSVRRIKVDRNVDESSIRSNNDVTSCGTVDLIPIFHYFLVHLWDTFVYCISSLMVG